MPGGVPMSWMVKWPGPFPVFVAEASGAHFTRRRRSRLRRPLPRRHRRDDRATHPGRRSPRCASRSGAGSPRCCRPRTRCWSARSCPGGSGCRCGSSPSRPPTPTGTRSATPATSPAGARSSCTTTATTAASTRPSRRWTPSGSGRTVPRRGNIGPPVDPAETTTVVEFNDVAGLEAALAAGDVAAVLCEPALTNVGIVLPDDGYHAALRELTRRHDVLLIIDETHTLSAGPGGYTRAHDLDPDLMTMGKAIAGGIPAGAFGMTQEVADRIARSVELEDIDVGGIGGTLAGNALSLAAMRVDADGGADGRGVRPDAAARATGGPTASMPASPGTAWSGTATVSAPAASTPSPRPRRGPAPRHTRRRLRARAVPAPVRAQPGHPADALPQHGADVAGDDRGRRRPAHRRLRRDPRGPGRRLSRSSPGR